MANNKIQLSDGTVLLDLSNDTVTDASHIMSGRVGHLANGLQVTGTGVNCPVFTLNFDANNDITSVTCNKTFNECLTLADNSEYAAIVQESHSGDISTIYGISGYSDYDTELYILYSYIHIYTALNDILADIRYTASGIQIISPSETLGEVSTPTAAKGSVSNHSINVTPSVTYNGGWIDSGSKTGSAVTVSASELVSGNKAITSNGDNIDVTNYATVSVNVSSGTAAISVVDTTDTHGGTVRTITALDISDTTAVAADVAQGKYFYTAQGVKTAGTGSGGTPSATVHTIYFEFTDETDTTITAYWDGTFISNAIAATTPTTYNNKTVTLAQLDSVTWYEFDPSETWETLFDGYVDWYPSEGDYPYCWISTLGNVPITVGSVYRVTYNNVEYRCTAKAASIGGKTYNVFGNPRWADKGGIDDGSGVPFTFADYTQYGAWSGGLNVPNVSSVYYFKIERLVTS